MFWSGLSNLLHMHSETVIPYQFNRDISFSIFSFEQPLFQLFHSIFVGFFAITWLQNMSVYWSQL